MALRQRHHQLVKDTSEVSDLLDPELGVESKNVHPKRGVDYPSEHPTSSKSTWSRILILSLLAIACTGCIWYLGTGALSIQDAHHHYKTLNGETLLKEAADRGLSSSDHPTEPVCSTENLFDVEQIRIMLTKLQNSVSMHFTVSTLYDSDSATCTGSTAQYSGLYVQWWAQDTPSKIQLYPQFKRDTKFDLRPDQVPLEGVRTLEARRIACFVHPSKSGGKTEVLEFFAASLPSLSARTYYAYRVGVPCLPGSAQPPAIATFFHLGRAVVSGSNSRNTRKLPKDAPAREPLQTIVAVGDLGIEGVAAVMKGIKTSRDVGLFMLLGDASYATNNGQCYNKQDSPECAWDCIAKKKDGDPDCISETLERFQPKVRQAWRDWNAETRSVLESVPLMTAMGNHDNDLQWFLQFRPPVDEAYLGVPESMLSPAQLDGLLFLLRTGKSRGSAQRQLDATTRMGSEPYFHSFDHGLVHLVVIGSEDNLQNPYEVLSDGEVPEGRFEEHFGKDSLQYRWLEHDLELANQNRGTTPWVVAVIHRPLYHSSTHHPMCQKNGDIFGCKLREVYGELLSENGVNLVLSGHSHHYSRSSPFHGTFRDAEVLKNPSEEYTTYVVCGTGGHRLTNSFSPSMENVEYRTGSRFGHCKLEVFSPFELKVSFVASGGKESSETEVLDSVTLTRPKNP